MHDATVEDIKKETRGYLLVFVALACLTIVTVGVSYLHLPFLGAVTLALAIAIVKGSLVAAYFMHLISERKVIYAVLILTVVFFAILMMIPTWGHVGRLVGPS
jgi:cytochrome c oxidase subunit IV